MAGTIQKEPKRIKRYEIIRPIGKGGMGRVFLAMDKIIRRPVAIKIFRLTEIEGDVNGKKKALRDFFLETQTAGALLHPNIVVIYDVGKLDKQLYMIMEYVYGRTLLDMHRTSELSVKQIVGVVYEIALALDYAHSKEVVHRDIKPENIIVSFQGAPKITDFGIARFRKHLLAKKESIVGSARFMAPEQILRKDQDHRVDIYQLGVVMYELLTRRSPFKGHNAEETLTKVCAEDPEPLDKFNNEVPKQLSHTVLQCLEKNASKRIQTAQELAHRLGECLKGGGRPPIPKTNDLTDKLRRLEMFTRFSEIEIEELVKASKFISCDPGKPIITEIDSESTFYILLEGNVKVVKKSQIITDFLPGACFGVIGAFARQKRSAVVIAQDHCKLLEINALLFSELSEGVQLKIFKAVVKDMASLIISLDDQIMSLTQHNRVARTLPVICPVCSYNNRGPIEVCPRCHTITTRKPFQDKKISKIQAEDETKIKGAESSNDLDPDDPTETMDLTFWSPEPVDHEQEAEEGDDSNFTMELISASDLQRVFDGGDDVELDE